MSVYAMTGMVSMPESCAECKMGQKYGCVGDVKCLILNSYFTGNVKPPHKDRPDECPLVAADITALQSENAELRAALSRVEAERDAAIQDSVVRCCGTCNACTQGTYNGRCMVCALCECVPERLREYHKNHYSKSLWKWRGAQGEG